MSLPWNSFKCSFYFTWILPLFTVLLAPWFIITLQNNPKRPFQRYKGPRPGCSDSIPGCAQWWGHRSGKMALYQTWLRKPGSPGHQWSWARLFGILGIFLSWKMKGKDEMFCASSSGPKTSWLSNQLVLRSCGHPKIMAKWVDSTGYLWKEGNPLAFMSFPGLLCKKTFLRWKKHPCYLATRSEAQLLRLMCKTILVEDVSTFVLLSVVFYINPISNTYSWISDKAYCFFSLDLSTTPNVTLAKESS